MRVRSQGRPAVTVVVALAIALLLASCSPSSTDPPGPPAASAGAVVSRAIPPSISSLALTNQHGRSVTLASLRGKAVMVVPFLTLCTEICPMTTGNLLQVEQQLARDGMSSKVAIVEVSVDPGRDDVARLAAYANITGADWDLTTETPADLAQLARFFGFYYQQVPEGDPPDIDWLTGKPLTYDVTHSDGYALVDPSGREVFANDAAPAFHGKLPIRLQHFLSDKGAAYLAHPPEPSWTSSDALAALGWALKKPLGSSTS